MAEAVFGLVGVLVGSGLMVGYSYYRDRREREEQYKQMLYPKLVEVHQEGSLLLSGLANALPNSMEDMEVAKIDAAKEAIDTINKWWDTNDFYITDQSSTKVLLAISSAEMLIKDLAVTEHVRGWDEHQRSKWRNEYDECRRAISHAVRALKEGIGMKHIEKPQKEQYIN